MNASGRFDMWPWRDFGLFGMTRRQAVLEAVYARTIAEQCGLRGVSEARPASEWRPWDECDKAAFAAAGIGEP